MKRILAALLGIIVFAPGVLAAHEGEDHMKHDKVMGTVASVDAVVLRRARAAVVYAGCPAPTAAHNSSLM